MEDQAHEAYLSLVNQARLPEFFKGLNVPDTLDGRFELICLHMVLILRRLKDVPVQDPLFAQVRLFGQALYDTMFIDFDLSLREMGVGDMGIGRRVKQMVQALHGRIEAYEISEVWDQSEVSKLREAISRNLYGTCQPQGTCVEKMLDYVARAWEGLSKQSVSQILKNPSWPQHIEQGVNG